METINYYNIIEEDSSAELSEAVMHFITNEEAQPYGSPFTRNIDDGTVRFCQAVVKYGPLPNIKKI